MKLLRPLAGYTLHDHKTNDSVRRELQADVNLESQIRKYSCMYLQLALHFSHSSSIRYWNLVAE
jgi:hypothetical protein